MTILCITPNANLERTWLVPGLRISGAFRIEKVILLPSGKGINAARAIHRLEGAPFCTGFLGGNTGKQIESLIERLGIPSRWTWIEGESRLSAVIRNPQASNQDTLLLSEPGAVVNLEDWRRLRADVASAAEQADYACISGSMPQGTDLREIKELILDLKTKKIPTWVDCEGTVLESALCARPDGIKINIHEAAGLLGRECEDIQEISQAASELRRRGIKTVILTMGARGAVLFNDEFHIRGFTPAREVVSSVGSGDAFMGGLLSGLAQGFGIEPAFRQALAAGAANSLKIGAANFDLEDFQKILPKVQIEDIPV